MRKITGFVLSLMLVFTLAACGSTDASESVNTSQAVSSAREQKEIAIDVKEKNEADGVHFLIATNLPDETDLMLTLIKKSSDFKAQSHVIVKNGSAESEGFTDKGNPLSGDFILSVTMSLPKLQPDSVRAVIGENGENITGQYVNKEDGTVKAEFNCTIKAPEQQAEKTGQETESVDKSEKADNSVTAEQSSALQQAKEYLSSSSFSHDGLVHQLEYEGFSNDAAVYAADNCGADWREQAVKSAANYLHSSSFSYDELVHQLEYEGFSHEDAVYAVDNCSANWGDQAEKSAKSYLSSSSFSYDGLVQQLEHDGYSHEDSVRAVDGCGADWNEQAVKSAKSYRNIGSFSHDEMVHQLESEGFTTEQAEYGASATE